MSDANSAATIERLTLAAIDYGAVTKLADGRTIAFRPSGPGQAELKDISLPHQVEAPKPKFITAAPQLQTVDALIDYVNLFKTPDTVIFADAGNEYIRAVIDYHKAASTEAGIVKHTATLDLGLSEEFQTWLNIDTAWMPQQKFARFIEQNAEDIAAPKGADLLEMVLDLEKSKTVSVARKLRSAGSDDGSAGFSSDASGTVLPAAFKLAMPLFFGETNKVEITAYTKDQLEDGKIFIGFDLNRVQLIRQREFTAISKRIAEATGVPFVLGTVV